ncbi:MAG: zinc-dependent metalloprotease family protein [Crocinitomicaceae bacterium]
MKTVLYSLVAASSLLLSGNLAAQNRKTVSYPAQQVSEQTVLAQGDLQITATDAIYFEINEEALVAQLNGIMFREVGQGFVAELDFPHPDGTFHTYHAKGNHTVSSGLAANYPEIHTYDAYNDKGHFVKWDITHKGLHVMIFRPDGSTIFIDPAIQGNTDYYIVYTRENFVTDKERDCQFDSDLEPLSTIIELTTGQLKEFGTCELRTYRCAIAATGEYTSFQGGTVNDAVAAQATTMNRVNGIYEKDMAITMEIIANNDQIVYTNSGTDPYSNGNTGAMIAEVQVDINNVIGSSNYDIGHVFGTNSGGLAGLGVVCSSSKARGVTGSGAPVGDPFDVDYVAHEMGHQFGANHTQNNDCNRNNSTAMEPGSASTIMGYAGICAPNVQNNSDDHFHGVSLEEISFEILSGGHQCESITQLSNTAPDITGTNGGATVPANTPFALTAVVDDPDNDPLTYNWEQMDNQASTQPPVSSSTNGPNFRSWPSDSDPTRYFPRLSAVKNNGPFTWERLPSVSRTMNFRVTVRDNSSGAGGCNDHADVTVTVDGNSGPFEVTSPNTLGIVWYETQTRTVTWDVANTNNAPVNCQNVDIFLSIDGGNTFPITLVAGVPNTGSAQVTVPSNFTNIARVMVMSEEGTFFDMSDFNFTIAEAFAGLEEVVNGDLELFPNPTKDVINVHWTEEVATIELTDATGKILETIDVSNDKETTVNLQNYSTGVYLVRVSSNEGTSVHQVIKE